jgi:hypothetical protein
MKEEDWRTVSFDLETGICLWIGAGVSGHLARSIGSHVPDWNHLTAELEREAGIATPPDGTSNPERLEECKGKLGQRFYRVLARAIYGELCLGLARFAHDHRDTLSTIPDVAVQLAALGWRANPIVNFNIETFTSTLVARPGGPCRILPYRVRERAGAGVFEQQEVGADFNRVVYHPHGATNYSGQAVMTSGEYATHEGSLAYFLAVSAAFENNLWICGMSLDDAYLREALLKHRRQINQVRWFDDEKKLARHKEWATAAGITSVPVDWGQFWATIQRELGPQTRSSGVGTAWFHILESAVSELVDGTPAEELQKLAERIPELKNAAERVAGRSEADYHKVFDRKEALELLPPGFSQRAIIDEIAAAISRDSAFVDSLISLLDENGGAAARELIEVLELARPVRPRMRNMNVA